MGLLSQMVRVIVHEHKIRPITGRVLTIGRQDVPLTPEDAVKLLESEGVPIRRHANIELDSTSRHNKGKGFITDRSLFSLFCDASVQALDVSDYEGAEIICNLNEPIPDHLVGQFDFIYNGSCLDNIFDPATSIKNMSRFLKPEGRIVHLEHGTPVNGPYLVYPVDWFFDYYAINEFADCKTYLAHFKELHGPWDVYAWDPLFENDTGWQTLWWNPAPLDLDFMIITVAERAATSTWERSPVQRQYRSDDEHRLAEEMAKRFWKSKRPKLDGVGSNSQMPHYSTKEFANPTHFRLTHGPTISQATGFLSRGKKLAKKFLKRMLRRPAAPAVVQDKPSRVSPFRFCKTLL